MNRKGFSFVELLIVTAIFTVIVAASLSLAHKAQFSFRAERDFTQAAEQARIAMDQLIRYLRQAGNDPTGELKKAGVEAVVVTGSGIVINSDITGSGPVGTAPSPGNSYDYGDPDGDNNDQMEQVVVQYAGNSDNGVLYLDIGDGNGSQALVDNLADFQMEFFDRYGNATTTDIARVVIRMTAVTGRNDLRVAPGHKNRIALRSSVVLRNKTLDLYEPPPEGTPAS